MSKDEVFQPWFTKRGIEDVEAFVPDMAGSARGKVIPAAKFGTGEMKMPESIFSQTVSGDFIDDPNNVEDRDMLLVPDATTLRPVPWATDPAASVFLDCYRRDMTRVPTSPRGVLRRVLAKFESSGWIPVVAPEVEFYLLSPHSDPMKEAEPPEGRLGWTEGARQPYSIDTMNDFDPFINDVYAYCEDQGIRIDTLSQEAGPAQFEINFLHGNAVDLADQVFLFKRTVREAAIEHEMHATFLAKPMSEDAGSALHIHQSVVDKQGNNIFSTPDGEPSELFYGFLGGLQRYMPDAMLIFAPYVNSYRRFLNPDSSPVNLAWAIDNRTVGLRVPDGLADARRIENRVAGSDVNPYLAIAATLACGYLGMVEGSTPTDPISGSAYGSEFKLHWHIYSAIEALRDSNAMRSMLGDEFVTLYCGLKHAEFMEFEEIITPWEREILMFNV
ncbi:MAG: glutamine synthetase family protein [Gammaproteobacteria bacterium]|nr:glutamine synthetase family protein [Gammaproteobacteria bacterium]MDH3756737.1 glutamine synthetase family protein [Gammaproteobacteria bacterium]MDH3862484.1 glutamine synthetase family protein [Gammaproteobacteria bacterium]MDH3905576.1 glutamine synthetase family protein [Gammaproteobacteria bacterium]MDH3953063.1 glutamine synthetase family protein [Gammaproteobacteria bacterium]